MSPVWRGMTFAAVIAILFMGPIASTAAAADAAGCVTLESDAERLACYDRVHNRPARIPAPDTQPAPLAEPGSPGQARRHSLLDSRWELDPESKRGAFLISPYKPVYFLPYFHASQVNSQPSSPAPGHTAPAPEDIDANEAKLQVGFKMKLWENVLGGDFSDLWFGYTQSSRWQVYNGSISRPFRETNYEPEALLVFRTDYDLLGLNGRMFAVGLNHQSNGRSLPLSRSWNRITFPVSLEHGQWALTVRPWIRVKEDLAKDDNPDISDYVGRGDAVLVYHLGEHEVSAMLRHTLRGGERSRGAVQLDWAFPIKRQLRGHLQWFSGYGESLIDYNHRSTYFGIGISLVEWYR